MKYNQISKFFNIDTPEVAGGGAMQSIASLMASQGVVNNGAAGMAAPINISTEKIDEPTTTATENAPAETATSNSPAETAATSELQTQVVEPEQTPTPQIAAEPTRVPTLQEVLKSQQPDTVLKELGYDDNLVKFLSGLKGVDPKVVNFLNTWKNGGDVTSYLKEWTTDYSKLSAEDVMRHQLRQEHPKASDPQIEALFKREVTKAYSLDSEDEAEAAEGKLLLDAKADRYRETLLQKQKDYLFPAAPEPKAPEPDLQAERAQQVIKQVESQVREHPYTKNIFSTKKLSIGEGDDKFTFDIEPEELVNIAINGDEGKYLFDERKNSDGTSTYTPKTEHQLLVATVQKYGMKFINELAIHYKSLGGKSLNALIENASGTTTSNASQSPESAPKTAAEAMARSGRLV